MARWLALFVAAALWPAQSPETAVFAFPETFTGGFTQKQVFPDENGGEQTVEITGTGLTWTAFDDLPPMPGSHPSSANDSRIYRVSAGSIAVKITGHASNHGVNCTISGEQTYSVAALRGALTDFRLSIQADKTYSLRLWMHSRALAVMTTHTCRISGRTLKDTVRDDGNTVMVALDVRKPLDARASDFSWVIAGTSDTRVPPPGTLEGSWKFVAPASR